MRGRFLEGGGSAARCGVVRRTSWENILVFFSCVDYACVCVELVCCFFVCIDVVVGKDVFVGDIAGRIFLFCFVVAAGR